MGIIEEKEEMNDTEVEEVPKVDERLPGYIVDEPATCYDWDLHLEEETRPSVVRFDDDDQMSTIQRLKEEAYKYYNIEEGDGEVDEGLTRTADDDEVTGEKCDPEKTVGDEGPWGALCKQKAYWQLGPPHLCLEGAACSECESETTTEDDLSSQNSGDEPGCGPCEKPATLVLQLHLQKDRVDVCYLLVGSLSPPHSTNFTFRCIVLDMTGEWRVWCSTLGTSRSFPQVLAHAQRL
uniref:Uncharacterized protein n=1 Tax=Timema poppense TaxID=170557 RepID=A0A7R9HGX6_TIMPO|nr:unnamed protein product [Timema poppensis]